MMKYPTWTLGVGYSLLDIQLYLCCSLGPGSPEGHSQRGVGNEVRFATKARKHEKEWNADKADRADGRRFISISFWVMLSTKPS
ncbi:hypothetical protein, partial [Gracilimonas sp.]|uniref:hypothetical protein n=1 Tax=Gracilimonas sp. TaxID=1974203 RepID=UPI0028725D67|nr:hypothetical protein [Gracilimonas sp.]